MSQASGGSSADDFPYDTNMINQLIYASNYNTKYANSKNIGHNESENEGMLIND